ncbi:MAG: hypothetical protein J5851_10730 [Oscillospiraceae bacterium]|nr:hypothetical protein [Oscillospiraceae bacterium]
MEKKIRIIWSISLLIISCVTLVIVVSDWTSLELPDMAKRVLGIINLLAIPVLVYSSTKLRMLKNRDDE